MTRSDRMAGIELLVLLTVSAVLLNMAALGLVLWAWLGGPVWAVAVGAGWLGLGMLTGPGDREDGRELSRTPTHAESALARYLAADPADPTATLRYLDEVDPVGLPAPAPALRLTAGQIRADSIVTASGRFVPGQAGYDQAQITALTAANARLRERIVSDGLDTYVVAGPSLDSAPVECKDESTPNKEAA